MQHEHKLQQYFCEIAEETLKEWIDYKEKKVDFVGCVKDAKKLWQRYTELRQKDEISATKWLIDLHFCVPSKQIPNCDLQNLEKYIQKQSQLFHASMKTAMSSIDWSAIALHLKKYE